MFKTTKLISAIILAVLMCFATVSVAFASSTQGPNSNGAIVVNPPIPLADGTVSVQAAITKVLQMPIGTTVPGVTFEFAVSKNGVVIDPVADPTGTNLDSTAATIASMPALTNLSAPYPGTVTGVTTGDTTTYTQETGDIFANITNTSFPHAGVYQYTITEVKPSYTPADPTKETMTDSKAQYTINVYVANVPAPGTGTYIYAIGDYKDKNDDGTANGAKVDPTPGGNTITNTGYSDMAFTNTYIHTNTVTDPVAGSTLAVSKAVTGTFADMTTYFGYSMTVNAPTLVYDPLNPGTATAPTYSAYILYKNGSKITGSDLTDTTRNNVAATNVDTTTGLITVTSGTQFTYSLQDGQKLVFVDTPVGTSYSVNETGTLGYTPSETVTYGSTPLQTNTDAGTKGSALSTDTAIAPVFGGVAYTTNLVGESTNSAAFTNDYQTITPTGILINNLPFIGLILLAVGAFGAYVVVKSRKRKAYSK